MVGARVSDGGGKGEGMMAERVQQMGCEDYGV